MNDDLTEASLERLAREAAKDGPIGMKVTPNYPTRGMATVSGSEGPASRRFC